jgi:hypothetical protein
MLASASLDWIDMSGRTARTKLWTFNRFASGIGTPRLPYGAHELVLRRHTQATIQANISSRRLVRGATATMFGSRVAWRECVVELYASKAVAFLTRSSSQRRRAEERNKERPRQHIMKKYKRTTCKEIEIEIEIEIGT